MGHPLRMALTLTNCRNSNNDLQMKKYGYPKGTRILTNDFSIIGSNRLGTMSRRYYPTCMLLWMLGKLRMHICT